MSLRKSKGSLDFAPSLVLNREALGKRERRGGILKGK
jgi:hypothetical protein